MSIACTYASTRPEAAKRSAIHDAKSTVVALVYVYVRCATWSFTQMIARNRSLHYDIPDPIEAR